MYNRTANTLDTLPLSVREPRDLAPWTSSGHVLMTAIGDDGHRRPYRVDTATGTVTRTLEWLKSPVERLNVSIEAKLVAWSTKTDTEIARLEDGTTVSLLPGVERAVPHPDGKWVALETKGAPISHFDQMGWDALADDPAVQRRKNAQQP